MQISIVQSFPWVPECLRRCLQASSVACAVPPTTLISEVTVLGCQGWRKCKSSSDNKHSKARTCENAYKARLNTGLTFEQRSDRPCDDEGRFVWTLAPSGGFPIVPAVLDAMVCSILFDSSTSNNLRHQAVPKTYWVRRAKKARVCVANAFLFFWRKTYLKANSDFHI